MLCTMLCTLIHSFDTITESQTLTLSLFFFFWCWCDLVTLWNWTGHCLSAKLILTDSDFSVPNASDTSINTQMIYNNV